MFYTMVQKVFWISKVGIRILNTASRVWRDLSQHIYELNYGVCKLYDQKKHALMFCYNLSIQPKKQIDSMSKSCYLIYFGPGL